MTRYSTGEFPRLGDTIRAPGDDFDTTVMRVETDHVMTAGWPTAMFKTAACALVRRNDDEEILSRAEGSIGVPHA